MGVEMALPHVTAKPKLKPRREDVPPGECLCGHCPAKCCRYFALTIEKPRDWEDFDFIRWYVLHERAAVFVEEDAWFLLVRNRCKHLGDDNRCGIYHARPDICRGYTTRNCEYEDDWVYDHLWETPEQVEEYAEAILGPRKGTNIRSKKPKGSGFRVQGSGLRRTETNGDGARSRTTSRRSTDSTLRKRTPSASKLEP